MRFTSIVVPLISLVVLSGCGLDPVYMAERDAERAAAQERYNKTIPICVDEKDCIAKWEAAQLWVAKNAGFKIQTTTNVLIETYNPTTRALAVSVTKEPIGGGKYKIVAEIWCRSGKYECIPDAYDATLGFNRTVSAATP